MASKQINRFIQFDMNYEQDIKIDETALDIEWLEQPSLMMKYAREAANARLELDQAKEQLDLVRAELDKKIRSTPENFGIEKITETAVQNTIMLQKEYVTMNGTLLECKYNADIASAAVRAIEARKDALENLVRLHGQQYFAGPKVPRDLSWERKERQDRVDTRIAKKLTRNTTRTI